MHPSLSHLFCSEFLHSPSSNRRDQSQIEMQKVGGCKIRVRMKKGSNEWVRVMLGSKFFEMCVDHEELKKNEKNLFCVDCNLCFCKHCVFSSAYDCRLLQICRYVYHDVVRLNDIHPFLDCSLIQSYKINGEKAVHLNPRPQLKDAKSSKTKGGGTCCEACGRHIQDLPNRFCCIACKGFNRRGDEHEECNIKKCGQFGERTREFLQNRVRLFALIGSDSDIVEYRRKFEA